MSKDIRSFFMKKDGGYNGKHSDSMPKSNKKRTLKVIESDSDDDVKVEKPVKKKQKEAKPHKTPEKKDGKPKASPSNISSYFGASPVGQKEAKFQKSSKTPDAKETKSLSRETSKSKKNPTQKSEPEKKSEINDSFASENDGFEESLSQINELELEKLSKKETKATSVKKEEQKETKIEVESNSKKTPVKEGKSPAKKPKTPGSAGSKGGRNSFLDSEQKRKHAESYQRYLQRSGPKNPGSKEVPKGTPTCLQDLTFVISGVLDSLEREEAIELIQKCGGRITTSISKKTNYIVIGEEPGATKLEKANKLGTKKLTEDELLDLIRSRSAPSEKDSSSKDNFIEGTPEKETSKYFKNDNKGKRPLESNNSLNESRKKVKKTLEVSAPEFYGKPATSNIPQSRSSAPETKTEIKPTSHSVKQELHPGLREMGKSMWVDKYKPKSTKEIIGQGGDKSNVKKLIYWLKNWSKNHLHSNIKKPRPPPWQSQDGSSFKAVLLSGPPGVGKTTTVELVCKELGLDKIEFNASDTRSKKLLQEEVSELLSSKSVKGYFQGEGKTETNQVLVMDEVDGMAGNEDRGGIQELIQVIKKSKVPVICMCNDRSHPKIRSLVNYCYDLRYNRPRVDQIKVAIREICSKEKVDIPDETLEGIIINTNHDVRQVLHNLSLWAVGSSIVSNDEEEDGDALKSTKPLNLGPWDVTRKVFSASEHPSMSLREKEDLFFQDYSLGPLFVQDTYVRVKPHKAKNNKKATMYCLSKAADAIMLGDVTERAIRSENAWSLLPVQAIFSTVLPGHHMEGHVQGQIQFPVWFGKNSKRNRCDRILQELQSHMRLSISGGKQVVNLEYLYVLRDAICRPLVENGAGGVSETLKVMGDYNLTKDDVDSIMELSLWPGGKDTFASIDSKVKAALTRAYNKEGKAVPFATSVSVKKKKIGDEEYPIEGEENEDNVDESDDDDVESDAMIKKGKVKSKTETEEGGRGKAKKEKGGKGTKKK